MAEKKIFTSLAFQSGANLIAPKVEARTPLATLTDPTDSNYYTGSAGQLAYNNGNIWVNNDSIWTKLLNHATTATISGDFTFDRVDSNSNGAAPFFIGSNSNNKLVPGLNASQLNGREWNEGVVGDTIVSRDGVGRIKAATPTADDYVATKGYVDNAVQGLDHKESVKYATTANLSSISGTGTISGVDGSVAAGDRILVKNQTTSVDNGIYVATSSGNWNRATDADESGYSNLVDFTNAGTSSGWSATDSDTAVWNGGSQSSGTYYFTPVTPTLVAGKTYKATLTITNYSGTGAFGMSSSGGVGSSLRGTANTTVSVYFVANGDPIKAFGLDTNNGTIDLTIKETDLTEGAFVFVESGATLANSSWVLSDIVNHPPAQTWVQFSAAGQIEVKSNSATAAPLTKVNGDTINFAYNTDRFALNSNALDIKADGILSTHIADGQITPAQLVNSSSFTMGGLTVNGDTNIVGASTTRPNLKLATTSAVTDGAEVGSINGYSASQFVASIKFDKTDSNNGAIRFRQKVSGTNTNVGFISGGKLGLGADASSPSGTLHVSTARYSTTDKISNGAMASTSSWTMYNAGDVAITTTSSPWKIVNGTASYDDSGAQVLAQDSVFASGDLNKLFKLTFTIANVSGGDANFWIGNKQGSGNAYTSSNGYISYGNGTHEVEITPTSTSLGFWAHTNGGSFTIDNISCVEDTLTTAGTLSVNSAADDLVIANNDHGGLSIITPADKKGIIFFGDKDDNDRGGIKYDHAEDENAVSTDERMEFSVNGDNKALTLHSDLSAKFEGHIGAGGMLADGVISGKTPSNGFPAIQMFSHDSKTIFQVRDADNSCAVKLYDNDGGTVSQKVEFHTNGTSYFNGGNVAIGGTTANSPLTVHGGSHDAATIEITNSANSNARLLLNSGHGNWSVCNSDTLADALEFRDETADSTRLLIDSSGTQNHKSNSIVNSATVAGLQDGACYDFDGSDDWIDAGSGSGIDDLDKITISAWVKFEGWGESNAGRIVSKTSTANTAGWTLYTNNSGRIGLIDDWTTTDGQYITVGPVVQLNKWYHIAVSYDRSTAAQAPTFYVNGTVATYDSSSSTNSAGSAVSDAGYPLLVGARRINSTSVDREFDGQIRDVKIFPSALDAADIRKLYSGENPKKNLNVDTFLSLAQVDSEWSISGRTASTSGANFKRFTLNVSPGIETEQHLIKLTVSGYSGQGYLEADTLTSVARYNSSGSSVSTTAFGSGNGVWYYILKGSATAVTAFSVYGKNTFVGSVEVTSVEKIETLVDFNPQSASSTKWYNEAIPLLYHGTVNNATLSQGNSYWNNIKQTGTNVESTELTLRKQFTNTTTVERLLTLDTHDKSAAIALNAGDGVGILFKVPEATDSAVGASIDAEKTDGLDANTSTRLMFRVSQNDETLDTALKLDQDLSAQFYGKLGVGHDAHGTHHLSVNGSSNFLGSLFLTNSTAANINAVTGHMGLYFDSDSNANVADRSFTIYNRAAAAFKIDGNSNVAIGSTDPASLLDLTGITESSNTDTPTNQFLTFAATNYSNSVLEGSGLVWKAKYTNYTKTSAEIKFIGEGNFFRGGIGFYTNGVSDKTTAASEVLRLKSDGTQDHNGNRIVNSQTVNDSWRTSEPSLRFDGDGDYVNCGTGLLTSTEITIATWVKTNDKASPSIQGIVTNGHTGSGRRDLIINGSQFTFHQDTTNNIVTASTAATTNNTWHHVAVTSETNSSGNTEMKMYLNGVLVDTDTATGILTGYNDACYLGRLNSDARTLNGELKDVRIHNRALDAEEVKGLYNGESTPWLYANAGAELISNGDFSDTSSWTLHQGTDATTSFGSGVITISNANSSTAFTGFHQDITTEIGKIYKITFTATVNSGAIYLKDNNSNSTEKFHDSLPITGTGSSTPTFTASGTYTRYFVADYTTTKPLWARSTANGNTINVSIDNISIVQVGEVAAYTPQSINDKWYDTTSNANHGTITGATKVGDNRYQGIFEVRGITELNPTGSSNSKHSPASGTIHLGRTPDYRGRIDYDAGSATNFSIDNTYNSASAKTSFGMKSSGTRLPVLELIGSGAVTATSASSTDLLQVARVQHYTIEPVANNTSEVFVMNHALNTEHIIVQVYEEAAGGALVETDVRRGKWYTSSVGNAGTGVTHGELDSSVTGNTSHNFVSVIFATAPAQGSKYRVTIIS